MEFGATNSVCSEDAQYRNEHTLYREQSAINLGRENQQSGGASAFEWF